MRCTVGDLAQARNRILADDPELAAHVRKLADARRKPSWLSEAAEELRDMPHLPATEAAAPDFELIGRVEATNWPIGLCIICDVAIVGSGFGNFSWNTRW
jgi:hypothetical protein